MSRVSDNERKTQILDAAEQAFADFGFEGASLRHIVLEAGVNLATVYYHFESKEGLMVAVFKRRFDPIRQEQLELLKRFEAEAHGCPVKAEKLLEAMVRPSLRLASHTARGAPVVMRLVGRLVTEPNAQIQLLIRQQFADVRDQFIAAFHRAVPKLSLADLRWRIEFSWGALSFILCNSRNLKELSAGLCDPLDTEKVLEQMIACFTPGFYATAKKCSS